MLTDRPVTISTGASRRETRWQPQTLLWSELARRLMRPCAGRETMAQYLALPRARQDDLKDVGGYVGGALARGRRGAGDVLMRELVTLDLDHIPAGGAEDVLRRVEGLGCAFALYSTRRHTPEAPRLRVVIPLEGPCTPEEYEPIARMAARHLGIDLCDPTTFEANRLMYWPSRCADAPFFCRAGAGALLSGPAMLDLYADWRDPALWPRAPGAAVRPAGTRRLGDPAKKPGAVGAFCARYDVPRAIAEFLGDVYIPADSPGRWTYARGSTAGGAVVYGGGRFLYSFHATDPCSGRLVNSYDLVRLHRFGALDAGLPPGTPLGCLPSAAAMRAFALSLPHVAEAMPPAARGSAAPHPPLFLPKAKIQGGAGRVLRPLLAHATWMSPASDRGDPAPAATADWEAGLARCAGTGLPRATVDNVVRILENDPKLSGAVEYDEFSARAFVTGNLPWKAYPGAPRVWGEAEDSQLIRYLEREYGIAGEGKARHGLMAYLDSHAVHQVRRYLEGLKWDGKPRLDTLFIDCLGVADTPYARAVTRKAFLAAVARVYAPGAKYDAVPVLCGRQGIGKSTVLAVMGGEWFSDSLVSFTSRDAAELIQGRWIVELGELSALTRPEVEAAKHFITKRDDQFRVPYARRAAVFPRRCVFFGTTNRWLHLLDATGNRRFQPLDCGAARRKSPWEDLPRERDQIWAEAAWRWRERPEPLHLPPALEAEAARRQREHLELDPRMGVVAEFLARKLPPGWAGLSVAERLRYWDAPEAGPPAHILSPRRTVSRQEVWAECYRMNPAAFSRREALEIDAVLMNLPGWERHPSSFRNGPYGTERGYIRSKKNQTNI